MAFIDILFCLIRPRALLVALCAALFVGPGFANCACAAANATTKQHAANSKLAPLTTKAAFKPRSVADKFYASIIPSLQDKSMEWWYNLPSGAEPQIAESKKVFYNEKFRLFSFVENAAIGKDGEFKIEYAINVRTPKGEVVNVLKDGVFTGKKKEKAVVAACPDVLEMSFDNSYPQGLYIFEIDATDKISGEKSKTQASVSLFEWSAPVAMADKQQIWGYIHYYYLQPSPETLYSLYFSKELTFEQAGAPNMLNYTYIGFFRAAFSQSSFLIAYLRNNFKTYEAVDRLKIILLLATMGEPRIDASMLSKSEIDYQNRVRDANFKSAYETWDMVIGAAQIDMLWGEFFATGCYKPVHRIMQLLSRVKEADFFLNFVGEGRHPKNKEEYSKMIMGALQQAAFRTLYINARRFPLVGYYCVWTINNKNLSEPALDELMALFEDQPASQKKGASK